jgi:hypothetical protein
MDCQATGKLPDVKLWHLKAAVDERQQPLHKSRISVGHAASGSDVGFSIFSAPVNDRLT